MQTMNIAIPGRLKSFAHERTQKSGFASVSEYVRDLIRADQKAAAREAIEALIVEGLESGDAIPVTREHWEEKRRNLVREFAPNATT